MSDETRSGGTSSARPFSFGSTCWPGVSKLVEECGEVLQVCGKLMGTGGECKHWDGSNLGNRIAEESADLSAALAFVADVNGLPSAWIATRQRMKLARYHQWHDEESCSARPLATTPTPAAETLSKRPTAEESLLQWVASVARLIPEATFSPASMLRGSGTRVTVSAMGWDATFLVFVDSPATVANHFLSLGFRFR